MRTIIAKHLDWRTMNVASIGVDMQEAFADAADVCRCWLQYKLVLLEKFHVCACIRHVIHASHTNAPQ